MTGKKGLTWILSLTFVLTLLFIFGEFFWFERQMKHLDDLYYTFSQRGYEILNTEHDLKEELIALEVDVRGFLLFVDENSLASYNQRKKNLLQLMADLESLLQDDAELKDKLSQIKGQTNLWLNEVLEPSLAWRKNGGRPPETAPDASRDPSRTPPPRPKDNLYSILNEIDELENGTRSLLESKMDEIHLVHRKILDANRIFFGVSAVIIALLFLVVKNRGTNLEKKTAELLDREDRLTRAVTELEQASRLKSEFLANVSHELRTPLNAIIGFAQVLQKQYYGPLTEKQAGYVNYILTSGQHLLELINDILDLSKIEAGKLELKRSAVSLCGIIENSLTFFREKAASHRLEIAIACDDRIPTLWADEQKLRQILFNLLSNAVKFTPDGGKIKVTATLQEEGEGEARRSWVKISVADTGIGIPPAEIKKLFQPFVQLDGSHTRRYEGTGLGLSLVKKLVELHGGRVWAESPGPGKGSTFSFVIPLVREDESGEEGSRR